MSFLPCNQSMFWVKYRTGTNLGCLSHFYYSKPAILECTETTIQKHYNRQQRRHFRCERLHLYGNAAKGIFRSGLKNGSSACPIETTPQLLLRVNVCSKAMQSDPDQRKVSNQISENKVLISSKEFANIHVEVSDNGESITLGFGRNEKSTYHASWLWSNDPQRVLLPSGQRTSTPGHWCSSHDHRGRPLIKEAKIIYCNISQQVIWQKGDAEQEESRNKNHGSEEPTLGSSTSMPEVMVPGPTPSDCCHPLSIYGSYPSWLTTSETDRENKDSRPYLQITWSFLSKIHVESNAEDTSFYDLKWLQRFRYDKEITDRNRRKTEVRPDHAIRRDRPPLWYLISSEDELKSIFPNESPTRGSDGLVHVNYDSVIGIDGCILQEGLFNLLHSVFRDGAAIVSNTPQPLSKTNDLLNASIQQNSDDIESVDEEQLPVAKLARAISGGELSHGSLYGNIFHVRVGERNSNNVAYTSAPLCPHQDLAYYESPPGMQLLHCVVMGKGVVGGESTLIDALAAAYRLRELRPESFEVLVKCPATFVKQRLGASMTYRKPHIVLAEEGLNSGKKVIDREITAVHWSPPFEGPVLLPADDVNRYYEAYADFERMLDDAVFLPPDIEDHCQSHKNQLSQYAKEFTWQRKLAPGEVLVFNNRRMLHGRRGFFASEGSTFADSQRHLVGCYTNIDDTLNTYRVLLREQQVDKCYETFSTTSTLNVGNGTSILP